MTNTFTLSNGNEVSLPLVCDDALTCFMVFTAALKSLPELPTALAPLSVGGRTLCVLLVADYRRMSIGPYREMVVMSPVRYRGGGRPPIRRGVFVHEIAVTSEISRMVGREVWGFPKYVADIGFSEVGMRIGVTMKSDASAFNLRMPRWGPPLPAGAPLPVFTVRAGKLLLSYIKMKGLFVLAPPLLARIDSISAGSSLSFLGGSARSAVSGFMKVSKATLGGSEFQEDL